MTKFKKYNSHKEITISEGTATDINATASTANKVILEQRTMWKRGAAYVD